MNDDDPEQRIAELERQLANERRIAELERELAEAKAAAGQHRVQSVDGSRAHTPVDDERARQFADELLEGMRTGASPGLEGPRAEEVTRLRDALRRAAADAGMSQEQLDGALQHANVTVRHGSSLVYHSPDPQDFGQFRTARFRPTLHRLGGMVGAFIGVLGMCVGGAAALTAVFPSSALWMSPIVCSSPHELAYNTSQYSYKPGQSGTSVAFQCVSDAGSYDVNSFLVDGIQSLLFAVLVGIGVVVYRAIRGRPRMSL
ncbi:hypothetical protein [Mycobacterium sp. 1423905.2]|uniref:hypothetical protein n=1 Tax=Mycobacterium sp. 1423905.2 TaxID=1856859 RepID=UPI0012E9D0BE|nr:hypothetical protein [Mycobacterium sp. 1423905.2]